MSAFHWPHLTRSVALVLACLLGASPRLSAQSTPAYPAWWANYGVLKGTTPNDYAAANQGQAKNIALAAVTELDYDLAQFGGSGLDALTATVLSGTSPQENDYAAINLGQLKALSQPFFDRLLGLGYNGPPLTSGTYPWAAPGAGQPNDYAAGNIGQLKYLFSFDVTVAGTNGIPIWWEEKYYGTTNGQPPALDPNAYVTWSGSQVTILQAYDNGWNPLDYYNGQTPTLSIVSGNNQTGSPSGFLPAPLIVAVTDSNGNAIGGAPVTFSVPAGSLQTSSGGTPGSSVLALSDDFGDAQMYLQLSSSQSTATPIAVTTGTGFSFAQVNLTASSDNGTNQYSSPFAPTNCVATVNSDGSMTLTWTNNTNNETAILIEVEDASGIWRQVASLAPGTTSYTIISPTAGPYRVNPQTPNGQNPGAAANGNPSGSIFPTIPVQTYAAIDISGSTPDSSVTMVALDDNNNAAFAWTDGTAPMVTQGYTTYAPPWEDTIVTHARTWQNGTVGSDQATPQVEGITESGTAGGTWWLYNPVAIASSGLITGYEQAGLFLPATAENPDAWVEVPLASCLFQSESGQVTDNLCPDAPSPDQYIYSIMGPLVDWVAQSPSGSILAGVGSFYDSDRFGTFLYQSGAYTIFPIPGDSGYNPPPLAFDASLSYNSNIAAVNDNGLIMGYDDNQDAAVWTGTSTSFIYLSPMEGVNAISNAGQVVGTTGANAYLWTSPSTSSTCPLVQKGQVQLISQLIPLLYQNEVLDISPIDISGTNAADGSVRILFNASHQTDSNGDWGYGPLLLTLTSGTTILQQVSIPSNVNLSLKSLNAQGTITGIGPVALDSSGNAHAVLLIPVQISVTFSYQGSGWNDSEGTLYSPEAIISAKIKAIPGVQITPQFVQDGDVTIKEEYDNNTGAICSCPGFLADDALNPIVDIVTDSDGNITATTTDDAPHDHPGSLTENLLWVRMALR